MRNFSVAINALLLWIMLGWAQAGAAARASQAGVGTSVGQARATRAATQERALPNWTVGVGAYVLEPREVTGAGGTVPSFNARPLLSLRHERPLVGRFLLEPQLGLLFPRTSREGILDLSGFVEAQAGYPLGKGWVVSTGPGLRTEWQFSSGQDVELNGAFVTPSGSSASWHLTWNAGVAYWVDPRFRLDAGAMASRLLSSEARKLRYLLTVAYAL